MQENLTATEEGELAAWVTRCFQGLNTYGKPPEFLGGCVFLMVVALKKYPYEKINKSFEIWVSESQNMPTPADIIKIIDKLMFPELRKAAGERAAEEKIRRQVELSAMFRREGRLHKITESEMMQLQNYEKQHGMMS